MIFSLTVLLSLGLAAPDAAESVRVTTSDAREVECSIYLPAGADRAPCLVVAPGRGYHKGLPIFTDLAAQATAAGFAVFTFDWHYFSAGTAPSEGLVDEIEDLRAMIRHARRHDRVDTAYLMLAGKSMGSVLAAGVFAEDDSLAALVLLTPVIPTEDAVGQYYPDLLAERRPVLIALGEGDEANCPLPVLYGALAGAARRVPVVVVGGDHGLNIGSVGNPATTTNISAANAAIVQWMRLWTAESQ
ncbi:alpha/beta hydrolase [Candidatus Fermentibacteria bacterium]|nr:alpha/beta hydrolase [Candidatus Fermentibacteria bacterium]